MIEVEMQWGLMIGKPEAKAKWSHWGHGRQTCLCTCITLWGALKFSFPRMYPISTKSGCLGCFSVISVFTVPQGIAMCSQYWELDVGAIGKPHWRQKRPGTMAFAASLTSYSVLDIVGIWSHSLRSLKL